MAHPTKPKATKKPQGQSLATEPLSPPPTDDGGASDFLADDLDAGLACDRIDFQGTPTDLSDPNWKLTPEQIEKLAGSPRAIVVARGTSMQSYLSEKLEQAIYASMFTDPGTCWRELFAILWALEHEKREFSDPFVLRLIANIKRILEGRRPEQLDDADRFELKTAIWELYHHLGTSDV